MKSHFFIVCQPGFEQELHKEILEFWPYLIEMDSRPNGTPPVILNTVTGGILIETSLILGLQINFFSKIASRVLLRLLEFRVRDFPKLHERLKKIDLQSYFNVPFRVDVAAAKSRLNNEKRILEVCKNVWPKLDDNAELALLIRMHDDNCTISVDTSGNHLHFRLQNSSDKWIGEAPVRETAAAFMLRKLIAGAPLATLQEVRIWDPMAGSGTLVSEAAELTQGNFKREFAFHKFPSCPKLLKSTNLTSNYPKFINTFAAFWASDFDEKMVEASAHNLSQVQHCKIFKHDIFSSFPSSIAHQTKLRSWIVLNPPYGERIQFKAGFRKLGEALGKLAAEKIGIVLPKGNAKEIALGLTQYELIEQSAYQNGGIPVEFSVFQIIKEA